MTRVSDTDTQLRPARPSDVGVQDALRPDRALALTTSDRATATDHADPIVGHSHPNPVCRQQRRAIFNAHTRPRHDDPAALLAAAARGDQRAWNLLFRRHSPVIRAIACRHRLSEADQDDVAQRTWLTLLRHVEEVKDPAALASWLATTARRECLRVLAASQREALTDEPQPIDDADPTTLDEAVQSERRDALHTALNSLPCHQRQLLWAIVANPVSSYDQLSAMLGVPRGSIGPTRGRCLARLRRDPHLARVIGG